MSQVRAWLALTVLVVANVTCSDLLSSPGAGSVTVTYGGGPTLVVGGTAVASAAATAGGSAVGDARFTFTSSDTSIIAIRGDTLVGRRLGTATITATMSSSLLGGSAPSASASVTVVPQALVLDSSSVSFRSIGDTVTLIATVLNADSLPITGSTIAWSTSDASRVAVNSNGRITAIASGSALIIAAANGKADSVTVVVTQVLLHYTFNVSLVTFASLTATQTIAATPRDARGSAIAAGASPTYQINDATVASVGASSGVVTSSFNGTTWLVAFRGAVRDSVQVTVTQRAKVVAIAPHTTVAMTSVGDTRQITASAVDSLNVPMASAQIVWIPLSASVYTVTQTGFITALATGNAFVVATLDGKRDSVVVSVTNDPGSVRISPDTATSTSIGDTLPFTAIVRNLRGDSIGVVPSWRTPDATIVTVLSDGRTIALKTGIARVIAQAGSRSDTSIAIITNVPASVAFTFDNRTLTALADADTPSVAILNARGAALSRNAVTWSSDDASIARVNAVGIVTAVDTGTAVIRACFPASCAGLQDSIVYTVQNAATSVDIILPPRSGAVSGNTANRDTLTAIGQTLALDLDVRNHKNVAIANYPVVWTSTDRSVVDTILADNIAVAIGFGTTKLIATAGVVADTLTLVVKNLTRLVVDNGVVANPRVGTAARPFLRIQDAVAAADANDTVLVKKGSTAYSETVALSKRIFLLGDSTAFVTGRNPANLPLIAHDTGVAAITAFTSAPQTIRYLAVRHTLDGPALDANGSDVTVDNVYVNPSGFTTTRIGRGISVQNSVSGTRITNSTVDSVRGYGVRLETVSNALVHSVVVVGVDSLPGIEEGAGIKLVSGNGNAMSLNFLRGTQAGVLVTGATGTRVDSNLVWRNTLGMRLNGGAISQMTINDIFDNDTLGLLNPIAPALTANNNWWGDDRGPRRNTAPAAVGDSVNGNVTISTLKLTPLSAFFAGNANAVRIVRGNGQTKSKGSPLNQALTVRVTDGSGFPVSGASVSFAVTAGGGSITSSATVTSNASGLAEANFTLGPGIGANTVIAAITVNGTIVFVTFTENGT